jgi:hypothetical protein
MLTTPQAFVLGHTVPIIGIYFRGSQLFEAAQSHAPLATRARELLASFDARKPGVIANVRRVESLLAEVPATAGDLPRMPADFEPWAARVLLAVEAGLAGELGLATIHLLGRLVGDALAQLNLGVYVLALDAAAPGDAWIATQLRHYRVELRRLATAVRGPAALVRKPSAVTALVEIADAIERSTLDRIDATQDAMKLCSERIVRIEAALA